MAYTNLFTERAELLGTINPASYNAEQNTGYVSLANYHRCAIILHCGVIGGNLDVDIEEGTDTSGTGAQTLDSGAFDITKTATTDNNTVSVIEFPTERLDVADDYDCVNVEVTPASAGIFSVEVWGLEPRFAPCTNSLLDVVETG